MWGKRGLAVREGALLDSSRDVSDRESGKIMRGEPAHALSIETAGLVKRYGSSSRSITSISRCRGRLSGC